MIASPAGVASLIVAQSELRTVRLIRAAIAPSNIGQSPATVERRAATFDVYEPRRTITPQPRYEARQVIEPEPVVLPPATIELPPVETEAADRTECVGPLPAPWQLLLREKVWNRPVATPPPASATPFAPATSQSGGVLDLFV